MVYTGRPIVEFEVSPPSSIQILIRASDADGSIVKLWDRMNDIEEFVG